LVDNYQPGDELYFFGFSRGAYTARSLAGLVRNAGIVRDRSKVAEAFAMYRSRSRHRRPQSDHARRFRADHAHRASNDESDPCTPDIKFIGVWDTVGSLGYPLPFFWFWQRVLPLLGINWWFHDTRLSKSVQFAYHAMSIHERRSDFPVTLWRQDLDESGRPKRSDQVLEQVWFPGVHGDVGGGYGATGLSDLSFLWMVERAKQHGLSFREHALQAGALITPDPWGRQHESFTGLFMLFDWLRLRFRGKLRDFSQAPHDCQSFAVSTLDRYRDLKAASWPTPPSNFGEYLKRHQKLRSLAPLPSAPPANSQDGRPPMAAS
jgi:hypothetical protein